MKKNVQKGLVVGLASVLLLTLYVFMPQKQTTLEKPPKAQRIELAFQDNFERTKDPKLGYPPVGRLNQALQQTRQLQAQLLNEKSNVERVKFRERGPNNIAGRTRTVLIDKNDPTGKTVFAGSVSGGIWKTNDITSSDPQWISVDDFLENLTVGVIAQDPNALNEMYVGTGEVYSGGVTGFAGFGIYKSVDGGDSWQVIESTRPDRIADDFSFVQDIFIHPVTNELYAGTLNGLFRSPDGGQTWEKILGQGLGASNNFIHDLHYTPNGLIYAAVSGNVLRSATGDVGSWESLELKSGYPRNLNERIEIDVCEEDPNYIYLIGAIGGSASPIYQSRNGGESWAEMGIPESREGLGNFARGQAWYDLVVAVDPFNCNRVIVGGIDPYISFNGGSNWQQMGHWYGGFGLQYVHADQHVTVFDKDREGVVYFGNDGGIYRSMDGGRSIRQRNFGYNVTQFYAGAFHPDTLSDYIIGGTQDNGSLQLDDFQETSAVEVLGGDGFYCHIDQNQPDTQLVSLYFAAYSVSIDGGKSFGGGAQLGGNFLSPSDYDDEKNILYAQTNEGDLYRWEVPYGAPQLLDIEGIEVGSRGGLTVSSVHVDPSTPNQVYVGFFDGTLLRLNDADKGANIPAKNLNRFQGAISSVAVVENDPNHILVTLSNYGLRNNIFESKDGGQTWTGAEGNLPDMPVRWVLFNPDNAAQAIIATEAGVWTTEKLDGDNTVWIPPVPGRGIPLVRTDMLQIRKSDKMILAATHGRGMFTTDVFSDPRILLEVPAISYLDAPLLFDGSLSLGGDTYFWDFGDGTTSTQENAIHTYNEIGEYEVDFTLNDELNESSMIKILPDRTLPYTTSEANYSGDFDGFPEDYGVYTISGSSFELGNSTLRGKDGTFSGDRAFVLGLNEQFYQPNTETMLYLPNFDFSDTTIYEFSFWSKYFVHDGFDGFVVEYSTDRGQNWRILGREDDNWYDFTNRNNLSGAAFPNGTPYFSRSRSQFTQFFTDLTFLAGQKDVAFRFRFKSNATGSHPGVVIDNVEIKKYDGVLQTDVVSLDADYVNGEEIEVNWVTQPEYNAKRFILERSFNGRDFEPVLSGGRTDATGGTTLRVQNYKLPTQGTRDLYFFRLRSINENTSNQYYYEFVTPTVVVSRNQDALEVVRTFPNPFTDFIDFTFNDFVEEEVTFDLYDVTGKLVYQAKRVIGDVYTRLEVGQLPQGTYYLQYKIGEAEVQTIKLLRAE